MGMCTIRENPMLCLMGDNRIMDILSRMYFRRRYIHTYTLLKNELVVVVAVVAGVETEIG